MGRPSGTAALLLLLALAAAVVLPAAAFKANEFKNCADANFCTRNRGRAGDVYALRPGSAELRGGSTLAAAVVNEDAEGAPELALSVTLYHGFLRLQLDEAGSGSGRYRVPDVLDAGFERAAASAVLDVGPDGLTLEGGGLRVALQYWPLKLDVTAGSALVASFNARQMLGWEHSREKKEGDPEGWWEEKFRSHTDSKPNGPEAISIDLSFDGFRHVYGLPERATSLSLKQTTGVSEPYRLYNLDVFEYLHESPFGLYGSIPMLLAHRAGQTVGAFWLNTAEMFVDVTKGPGGTHTQWIAESGVLDLFLMAGPSPAAVLRQYTSVTGTTALPQLFALGYHQCRWNYNDEADVAAVDAGFDSHMMPYDVLWLDIEHTNGKRYMTWDGAKFPTPARMQQDLASRGRQMVVIVDPHVKRDPGFAMHKYAEENHLYVRNKDNATFEGWCWPGSSSYLDMMNPAIREWWAEQFRLSNYPGSTSHLYVWNDMNEPSVFNGPEVTMQKDNIHYSPLGDVEHRDVHNAYGMFYHKATADGLALRGQEVHGPDGDRPFVLSRAFFAGTQTIGPIWTGDNTADWDHLRVSVPMCLALGITGLTYSGADVGGFFGNPDAELMTRWYQVGVFYPFFRGHAHLETKRREPWLFGEPATTHIRAALRLRYQLLPTTYTLFRAANVSGAPVMRPLWYEFPDEEDTFAEDEEFMFGPGLLVRPVLKAGAKEAEAFLPGGGPWYSFWDGTEVQRPSGWLTGTQSRFKVPVTMDRIPLYLRGGHITVRRDRPRRSTGAMAADPVTLVVALDAAGAAAGDLYLDDGHSYAFRRGEFLHRAFTFANGHLTSSSADPGASAAFTSPVTIERILILGLADGPAGWTATVAGGRPLTATPGPLHMEPALPDSALVIRKPELNIGQDFSIAFKRGVN